MSLSRVHCLLLLPLLTVGCEGPAGADGANGADGVAGTDGTDGTDGTNGTDGSTVLSGTLAPGEALTLEHGLGAGDKFYEAQFSWDGVAYDHSDYPMLRPGHYTEGTWFPSGLDQFYGDLSAATLSSGDLVVVHRGWFETDETEVFSIDIFSWDGALVQHVDMVGESWEDETGYGYVYDPVVVALGDGGFSLFYERDWYDSSSGYWQESVRVVRYDSTGTLTADTALGSPSDTRSYYNPHAVGTTDGGAVGCAGGWDEELDHAFTEVQVWGSDGSGSSFVIEDGDGSYCKVAALDDGRLALLTERRLSEDAPDGIDLLIAQTDGTLDVEVRIIDSYSTEDMALAQGSQGTLLVAAEAGGPDLPFYAVLEEDGTVVQPATGMSGWENTMIQATAFADGDFLILVTEDDSLAPMTWVVGARGGLLRPMVIGDLTVVPDYDPGAFFPGEGNTVQHIAPSYESEVSPYMSTYTKGLLQLRVDSDDAVTLHNETPDTLDVTLVAHRTP